MDNSITLKFFSVERAYAHCTEFEMALKDAFALGPNPADRERDINYGEPQSIIVRLERLVETRDFMTGELIRKQTSNIPPEAHDLGLTKLHLGEGGGLGLSCAFSYHKALKIILIQNNTHAVSKNRLNLYLNSISKQFDYLFEPIAREDAWHRFNNGTPRKLKLRVASPERFADFTGKNQSIGRSIADMGEMLHAPYITIEISMGDHRGSLFVSEAKNFINRLLAFRKKEPGTIKTLNVSVSDDGESDVIDFLEEHLTVKTFLDLSEDPDKNYEVRAEYLASTFNVNYEYLYKTYAS